MARPTLTIAILVKDEAAHLAQLLSTLGWADELIVVDDYSIDESATIAKKYNAKVHQRRLNNNFADQRNYALSKATGDWVLFLDADERVSDQLAHEIQTVIKSPTANGYRIHRLDHFMGKTIRYGEIASAEFVRLGKKNAGSWERPVHEIWNIPDTARLHHPLFHYSHPTVADLFRSIDGYTDIEARHRYHSGISWSITEQILYPPAKFGWLYIAKGGFRDGVPGLVLSIAMAYHSWSVRAKLFALQYGVQEPSLRVFQWLLFLTIGLLSLGQLQRIQIGQTVALNLFDVTIAASIFLWFMQIAISERATRQWSILSSWLMVSAALAISYVLGLGSMTPPRTALLHLVRWCMYGLYGWHVYDLSGSSRWRINPKRVLLLLIKLIAVWGFIQYVFIPDTRSLLVLGWDDHYYRLISTLFDPGYVSIIFVVGLLIIEGQNRSWKQPWYLALLSALLLTFARSGYLAYGVITALLHLRHSDLKNLAIKSAIAIIGVLLIPKPGGEGVDLTRTYSITTRAQSSRSALDIGLEHPFFGVGFNAYAQYSPTDNNPTHYQVPVHPSAPDNSLLLVFATAGIVGITTYIYLLAEIGLALKSDEGSLAAFGAIVLHACTNNTLFYPWIVISIWLLIANTANQRT